MARKTFTPDPEARKQESADLLKRIEAGIDAIASAGDFERYLKFAARFHSYSFNNTMLILMQNPEATQVAGFHTWLSMGRSVRKGEKSIRILAPSTFKKEVTLKDGSTEEREGLYFRVVGVFDVSQTEGEPLPTQAESPVKLLEGNEGAELCGRLTWTAHGEGLTIDSSRELAPRGSHAAANGYYQRSKKLIWLSATLPGLTMAAKTLAHELSHHFAEHEENAHTRPEAETIAEASACIVLNHYGIDSAEYSFGYLAGWGGDSKLFKAKLTEVLKAARTIIARCDASPDQMQQAAVKEAVRITKRSRKEVTA